MQELRLGPVSERKLAKHELTPREMDIPVVLVGGAANGEIKQYLGISKATVKQHMSVLLTTLQCNNRCKLAILALLQLGLCCWGMAATNTTQEEEPFSAV